MDTIIWKGIQSTKIDGLLICELPPISKPPLRVKETTIDGRDGSVFDELGYSSYDKSITIGLRGNFDINQVIKYFTGEGDIIFSNEPNKVYRAKVIGQIDYTSLLRFRKAKVKFKVQPFKYKYNETYKETQTATDTGTNIVLKDSGKAPMRIATKAETVAIHGKNIFNPDSISTYNSTSCTVTESGYKIVAVGGTKSQYTAAKCNLPAEMSGKTYCMKCDAMHSTQNINTCVQVIARNSTTASYFVVDIANLSTTFTVPNDFDELIVAITMNNTPNKLPVDNELTIYGLRITPVEFKSDVWCAFDGLQTLEVVDGVANANGYDSVTVISNADNAEMTVEYTKRFEVFNEGLESSKPKMVLHGSGTVGISVNGIHIFDYTFPEGETEVVIDSEAEDAYLGDVLKNRNMNGEFPVLLSGTNIIEWSGDVESIEILPRSRWL